MLVSPGDNVLVDSPTYAGALAAVSIILCCTCDCIYQDGEELLDAETALY